MSKYNLAVVSEKWPQPLSCSDYFYLDKANGELAVLIMSHKGIDLFNTQYIYRMKKYLLGFLFQDYYTATIESIYLLSSTVI